MRKLGLSFLLVCSVQAYTPRNMSLDVRKVERLAKRHNLFSEIVLGTAYGNECTQIARRAQVVLSLVCALASTLLVCASITFKHAQSTAMPY